MLKDRVIIGMLIGISADVIKLIFNYLAFVLGFTNAVFWQLAATRFLQKADLFSPTALLIGGVADLTITAILGVIFFYFIDFTGPDYLWIKGIGFGLAVWVGLLGTLLGQSVQNKIPQEPSGILVTMIAHLIFGLGLAFFTRLYHRSRISRDDLL